ncbi:MAG: (Fe-S)-binding protein [Gammaproteobacteria bacterium]|nr:(Fe-S)-binding protein [Gammaproteobacteria bacterium]
MGDFRSRGRKTVGQRPIAAGVSIGSWAGRRLNDNGNPHQCGHQNGKIGVFGVSFRLVFRVRNGVSVDIRSGGEVAADKKPRVGLFATCLVDLFRPNVGFATLELLERAGCHVEVPEAQVCCGQPAYNSGDVDTATSLAKQVIAAFEPYDYVVGPSGSCMAMLREHYPQLFPVDAKWRARADAVAARSFELLSFLVDVMGMDDFSAEFPSNATYHDSCSGLREMEIKSQPRKLIANVGGMQLKEMDAAEVCCGFGGTFCVKYPEISTRLVDDKLEQIRQAEANTLLGGDLGCLMNIAGRLRRQGSDVRVFHLAEVLAGRATTSIAGDDE